MDSKEVLTKWANDLQEFYPQLPLGFIDQILHNYSKNPDIFNQVVEDFKNDRLVHIDRGGISPVYLTVEHEPIESEKKID
jgi:hypothetical protein